MDIIFESTTRTFYLNTKNSTYAFFINELGVSEHLYYGKRIPQQDLRGICFRQTYSFAPYDSVVGDRVSPDTFLQEAPSGNAGDSRICALSFVDSQGKYGSRLFYAEHSIREGREPIVGLPYSSAEGAQSLELVLRNKRGDLEVRVFYVVWKEEDVVAKHTQVRNLADGDIRVLKASACVDLWGSEYDLVELYGSYHHEREFVQRTPLKRGVQGNFSERGASGHESNPFFAVCAHDATEDRGDVYAFNFVYSGNFKNEIQVDKLGNTRVVSGISDYAFEHVLPSGGNFCSPELLMTYTDGGLGQMSRNFHTFIRRKIVPPRFAFSHRPIVLNTWEAFGFEIDEQKILDLADSAKEIGAELLVVDDGWFRNDDAKGLGDFAVCKEKFPSGLARLSEKVHEKGLMFGLWFEPEMANGQSELYAARPDWVICSADAQYFSRGQAVLDLGNPEVVEYLFAKMSEILDGVGAEYIKWDMNRYISEVGSSRAARQGEVFHRYILGVYELLRRITERYPYTLIETCAGGGSRFDLGMLYYSPQIWTSDNTDPFSRVNIQLGTSYAYPPSSMGSHFTEAKVSGLDAGKELRYATAAFGAYGYEFDPRKLSKGARARLREYSQQYKREENVVLRGDLYRICSCDDVAAYIQVSEDKTQAVFTLVQFFFSTAQQSRLVRMKGLNADAVYRCSLDNKNYSGSILMNAGIRIGGLEHRGGKAVRITFVEQR